MMAIAADLGLAGQNLHLEVEVSFFRRCECVSRSLERQVMPVESRTWRRFRLSEIPMSSQLEVRVFQVFYFFSPFGLT